jgi:O-acetyl-ADP-ribose deacetylase (regulator of RNase III)
MREIEGNLVTLARDDAFDVIVHGCNCFHTMGAGIAKAIAKAFPAAYMADLDTPYGTTSKLGTISAATIIRQNGKELTIVNAYTQYRYGGGHDLDMTALERVLRLVNARFQGKSIGMPRIGCGLAGGDWEEVKKAIHRCLPDCIVTVVTLPAKG